MVMRKYLLHFSFLVLILVETSFQIRRGNQTHTLWETNHCSLNYHHLNHCFWQIEKCIAKAFWALYGIGVEKPDAMNQTFMSFPALREYLLRNIVSTHLPFFCDQVFINWGNPCMNGFNNIRILSFLHAHIVCVRTQCAMHTLACFCFLPPRFSVSCSFCKFLFSLGEYLDIWKLVIT